MKGGKWWIFGQRHHGTGLPRCPSSRQHLGHTASPKPVSAATSFPKDHAAPMQVPPTSPGTVTRSSAEAPRSLPPAKPTAGGGTHHPRGALEHPQRTRGCRRACGIRRRTARCRSPSEPRVTASLAWVIAGKPFWFSLCFVRIWGGTAPRPCLLSFKGNSINLM